MKNTELKTKFKNKYVIRVAAGAVTIAVLGTGVGAYTTVRAEKTETVQEETEQEESTADGEILNEEEKELANAISSKTSEKSDAGKEETVYVVAKADGTQENVIVSEWLKNPEGADTLKDASDLKDITNVKGDETFTQDGDKITWNAEGKDIYYQGTTDKELPVTEKVTYYLDGKEMSPEEIAGKSGKVTVRFDYTNHTKTTEIVNGESYEVCVPFSVMTGMILPEDSENVEVTNGKVISDGSKKIVVGVAMPGLKESLAIKDGDLDEELEIPEYVEVSAQVKEFKLDMTMSVIMSDLISEANLDEAFDLTKLEDSIDTMTDASGKLVDGSTQLAEGLDTLKGSMKEFASGVNTLKNGIVSYTNGAAQLKDGIGTLKNGAGTLVQGASSLQTGVNAVYDNFGTQGNPKTIRGGAAAVTGGAAQLSQGASDLSAGAGTVAAGAGSLKAGAAQVAEGAGSVAAGADRVAKGAGELKEGIGTLGEGVTELTSAMQGKIAMLESSKAGLAAAFEAGRQNGLDAAAVADLTGIQEEETKQLIMGLYQGFLAGGSADAASYLTGMISGLTMVSQEVEGSGLAAGVAGLTQGAAALLDGASSVSQGAAALSAGASQVSAGVNQVSDGASQVAGGAAALSDGSKTLAQGAATLQNGVEALFAQAISPVKLGVDAMISNMPALTGGINQLAEGASVLVSNNAALTSGAAALSEATGQVVSGIDKLEDGSNQLMEGMVQFDEEGIQKLADAYHGDIKTLLNRLEAVVNAGKDYQTFTKVADGTSGKVKFILRTEAVKVED